jgi:hypothetical protein
MEKIYYPFNPECINLLKSGQAWTTSSYMKEIFKGAEEK